VSHSQDFAGAVAHCNYGSDPHTSQRFQREAEVCAVFISGHWIWLYLWKMLGNWMGILLALDGFISAAERFLGQWMKSAIDKVFPWPARLLFAVLIFIVAQGVAYHDLQTDLSQANQNNDGLHREITRLKEQLANAKTCKEKGAQLEILYENGKLNGRTIFLPSATLPNIRLSEFKTKNNGETTTEPLSMRLYFSRIVVNTNTIAWDTITSSDELGFPAEFYAGGKISPITVHRTETWNWLPFTGQVQNWNLHEPIHAKLKVFDGSANPIVANFTIRQKQ
jgi:hypothetical protein